LFPPFTRPFVCECHNISTIPRFQPPAPFSGKLITDEFRSKDIVAKYELVHADFHDERMIQFTRKERPLFLALIPGLPANWLPPHKDRSHDIVLAPDQP
jgi:hypothetical protein